MAVGAVGGVVAWLVLVPVLHTHLMSTTDVAVVLATGATVATQLPVAVGKPCLQALGDARGSNLVTASEEAAFVPAMLLLWVCGLRSGWLLVGSLLVADVLVAALAWARIRRRVHEQGGALLGRVDLGLARRVVVFGLRSQVGGILSLLNLRLDVVILGALTGPAPVGVYVVASKYAELLRLPGLALTWVSYPRYAKRTPDPDAPTPPPALPGLPRLPGALGLGALAALVVAATAAFVLPFVYGDDFRSAVWPAVWIALGLAVQPAAGMASGFLLGSGSPGLNSLILGAGFGITVALDLWLIPRHGSLGAAWASATAYAATDLLLVGAWRRRSRGRP
jgi:O-antigen/teichoic acid export membrane protein